MSILRKVLSAKEVSEGSFLPPWYYGLTRCSDYAYVSYYHIIPLNFIIRAGYRIWYYWNQFRSYHSKIDIIKIKAQNIARKEYEESKMTTMKFTRQKFAINVVLPLMKMVVIFRVVCLTKAGDFRRYAPIEIWCRH